MNFLLGLHLLVWSELGRSPPFRRMRALTLPWSRAFSLVCEVALRSASVKLAALTPFRSWLGGPQPFPRSGNRALRSPRTLFPRLPFRAARAPPLPAGRTLPARPPGFPYVCPFPARQPSLHLAALCLSSLAERRVGALSPPRSPSNPSKAVLPLPIRSPTRSPCRRSNNSERRKGTHRPQQEGRRKPQLTAFLVAGAALVVFFSASGRGFLQEHEQQARQWWGSTCGVLDGRSRGFSSSRPWRCTTWPAPDAFFFVFFESVFR